MANNPPETSQADMKNDLSQDKQNLEKRMGQLVQENNPANAQEIASGKFVSNELDKAIQHIEQKNKTNPG